MVIFKPLSTETPKADLVLGRVRSVLIPNQFCSMRMSLGGVLLNGEFSAGGFWPEISGGGLMWEMTGAADPI